MKPDVHAEDAWRVSPSGPNMAEKDIWKTVRKEPVRKEGKIMIMPGSNGMITLLFGYTITGADGVKHMTSECGYMISDVQEEEFLKIVRGIADGLELKEIQGIDSVLERMRQIVMGPASRSGGRMRWLRQFGADCKMDFYLDPDAVGHIRDLKDPVQEMSRPEQNITVYRSDGSHVTFTYSRGIITYVDPKGAGRVFMTADTFIRDTVH